MWRFGNPESSLMIRFWGKEESCTEIRFGLGT